MGRGVRVAALACLQHIDSRRGRGGRDHRVGRRRPAGSPSSPSMTGLSGDGARVSRASRRRCPLTRRGVVMTLTAGRRPGARAPRPGPGRRCHDASRTAQAQLSIPAGRLLARQVQQQSMQPGQDGVALGGSRSQPLHPPPRLRTQPGFYLPRHDGHPQAPPWQPSARPQPGHRTTPRGARRAGPGRAGEQCRERRAAPGPTGSRDAHVSDRGWLTGWFWSVIWSMLGLPPPGASGC